MSDAPLMLSISGLRGWIGESLTPVVATRYGAAFGSWLASQAGDGGTGAASGAALSAPHVVVGRDSRPSGAMIEAAVVAGLLGAGCRVTTLGIATTPGIAVMVEHLGAQGGVVITASHNPIQWNGIKCLRHDGVAPPPDQAQEIIARYEALRDDRIEPSRVFVPVERMAGLAHDATAGAVHVRRILAHIDAAAVRRGIAGRKLKVVLDSVHGAGGPSTALLLRELGVELVHLYAEPTGQFPHPPEPTRAHLAGLGAAVREHGADLGLAQDPDADRLALVDETGAYIGEEYTLALASWHLLEQAASEGSEERRAKSEERGAKEDGGPARVIVANLSTSRMVDDIAARTGATVVRTPVGEAHVAAAVRARHALVGGEGNGGVIWPAVIHVRDSLVGAALVLELLAQRGQSLSQIVAQIPRYAILKDKVDLRKGMLDTLAPKLRAHYAQQQVDLQDGVRIDWPDRWVHVRPSNTEPIVRLIAEARDEPAAQALLAEVRAVLGL